MIKNKQYEYCGPVMEFDICVERTWKASTWAPSEKKALSNLTYRYKRDHNRAPQTKITLPGKIALVGGEEDIYGREA